MELLEKVTVAVEKAISDDPYCGKQQSPAGWKAVIDGIKGGVGDAAELRRQMLAAHVSEPVGPGRPRKKKGLWDLDDCDQYHFPYQSHHLVPEKQLPKHKVTAWLTTAPKQKHPKYVLAADTNYDTNHALNGYFMPFASTTYQWEATSNAGTHDKICFEMMRRTRRQLHQGKHSRTDYLEEVDKVETAGYKTMVDNLLNVVYERAEVHVEVCEVCKKGGSPIKVQPLEAVVRHVYRVGKTMQGLLVLNRVFVSRRAANYFARYQKAGRLAHPSEPII